MDTNFNSNMTINKLQFEFDTCNSLLLLGLTLLLLKSEYSGKKTWVNTMAADALAPCVARASAAMVLNM